MRILLINYEYPPLGGGAGNATAHLAKEMAQLGHMVFVLTSRFKGLPHQETIAGYTVIRVPARRAAAHQSNPLEMLSFMLSAMTYALTTLRQQKFDYSIAFFGIPSGPVAFLLKLTQKTPYIISLRGGDVPGFQPYDLKTFHALTRPIIKLLWHHATHVVANSQGLAALARQSAEQKPIPIIPNGVDTTLYQPAADLPHGKYLFAGRITQQKGLHFLVEAVAQIPPEQRANLHITLVGDGPQQARLQDDIAQKGVTEYFSFSGWLDRSQLMQCYQAHGGFILPSLDEGMPNVLLEAMACGLPIIATRIAGNEELVQGNGWLVPPRDAAALAAALQEALRQPDLLRQMGQKSRALAEQYSWEQAAKSYLKLMGAD